MPRGEIVIDRENCQSCGLCVFYCKRECLALVPEKLSTTGRPQASFVQPDRCTACCVCAWMCPHFAIEVYKYVEKAAPSAKPRP